MEEVKDEQGGTGSVSQQSADEKAVKRKQEAITERAMDLVMEPCKDCSLGETCFPERNRFDGHGPEDAEILVVLSAPPHPESGSSPRQYSFFKAELAKICPSKRIRFTWALRCATPSTHANSQVDHFKTPAQVETFKQCRHYLEDEINALQPKVVILCGPGPLFAALNKRDSHFQKYPGAMLSKDGVSYLVTYDPAYVGSSRKYMNELHAHIQKIPTLLLGDVFEYGTKYRTVESIEELERLVAYASSAKRMTFDFEVDTNIKSKVSGFGGSDALLGLGISFKATTGFYIPLDHPDSEFKDNPYVKDLVKQLLTNDAEKCAHNALYDCYAAFYFLGGTLVKNVTFDTMLAHHLIDPTRGTQSLKYLATMTTQFGGYEDELHSILESYPVAERSYAKIPQDKLGPYCCIDVDITFRLWDSLQKEIKADDQLQRVFDTIVMPSHELMFDLRTRAWMVDNDKIDALEVYYTDTLAKLKKKLFNHPIRVSSKYKGFEPKSDDEAAVEFNPNSPAHLREIIYVQNKMKAKTMTRPKSGAKGVESTDQGAMKEIIARAPESELSDFLSTVIQLKLINKALTTYITGMRKHVTKGGRLFSEYLQIGTETARLSSRKPNMQNISGDLKGIPANMKIKSMFTCPPKHRFVIADYSQIELRNLANCTDDDVLVQTFLDGKNNHTVTASKVFGVDYDAIEKSGAEYRVGKTTNFAAVYGAGPTVLAQQIRDKAELNDAEVNSACAKIGLSGVKVGAKLKDINHIAAEMSYAWLFGGIIKNKILDRDDVLVLLSTAILNELKRAWKGVTFWQKGVKEYVSLHGNVRSPFGRIRHLPMGYKPTPYERKHVFNQAINTPIQSVSSDCLLLGMIAINNYLKEKNFKSQIIGTVHDSVILYVHEDEFKTVLPKIKFFMEKVPVAHMPEFFTVPLEVEFEVGTNWGNIKEYDIKQLDKI